MATKKYDVSWTECQGAGNDKVPPHKVGFPYAIDVQDDDPQFLPSDEDFRQAIEKQTTNCKSCKAVQQLDAQTPLTRVFLVSAVDQAGTPVVAFANVAVSKMPPKP